VQVDGTILHGGGIMTITKNDASQLTRRDALGLLGTAFCAGIFGSAAGTGLVASAAGNVPVQAQRTLRADLEPSALAATLGFF
jgi:hypothetical protein